MSDYVIMVKVKKIPLSFIQTWKNQAKVFLGGPPLVKMATGEIAEEEPLGGAEMHSKVSGLYSESIILILCRSFRFSCSNWTSRNSISKRSC